MNKQNMTKLMKFLATVPNNGPTFRQLMSKPRKGRFSKPPTMNYNVQCMGVGSAVINIDGTQTYAASATMNTRNIFSDALAGPEFVKYGLEYRYAKVLALTVSVLPLVTGTNNARYIKVDWTQPEALFGEAQIIRDDNAKVVYGNETKNVVLKFKPPNVVIYGNTGFPYNPRDWLLTKDMIDMPTNFLTYLSVLSETNQTVLNWSFKIAFRGTMSLLASAKIGFMLKGMDTEELQKVKQKVKEREKKIKEEEQKEKQQEEENSEEEK